MLLTLQQFSDYTDKVVSNKVEAMAFDFETTGLRVRDGSKAFIMGFAHDEVKHCVRTDNDDIAPLLKKFFSKPDTYYSAHNASFELSFLKHQFGVSVVGPVWDSEVFERIAHNGFTSYSLENCAIRHKQYKYVPMMKFLEKKENNHWDAPESLIIPYVEQDAWLSLYLYQKQRDTFTAWNGSPVPVSRLVDLELRTTKNLFRMQETGLHLNTSYCIEAKIHENKREQDGRLKFKELTGKDFVNSRQCLGPIFREHHLPVLMTELKHDSFSDETLKLSDHHPITRCVRDIRNAQKRSSTYWENFLDLELGGMIYPSIRQAGTVTGRFSARSPNVQNWPDDETTGSLFPIRRAFVAPEGSHIISQDYRQMEYRFLMDQSKDLKGIADIINGADPHQVAADSVGVPRSLAKNAVFAKIYGAGYTKLSEMLGVSEDKAKDLAAAIDFNAPEAAKYCRNLIETANQSGWGYNIKGRRYFFPPSKPYCYPDYKIQGSCSEILRVAIDGVMRLFDAEAKGQTAVLIPIHDEIVSHVDECDLHLIPEMKRIMIEAYKPWRLPMDVSTTKGPNFHDLQDV